MDIIFAVLGVIGCLFLSFFLGKKEEEKNNCEKEKKALEVLAEKAKEAKKEKTDASKDPFNRDNN